MFRRQRIRSKRNSAAAVLENRRTSPIVGESISLTGQSSPQSHSEEKRRKVSEDSDEDDGRDLEALVLGEQSDFVRKLRNRELSDAAADSTSSNDDSGDEGPSKAVPLAEDGTGKKDLERKPAWVDEDDERDVDLPQTKKLAHLTRTTDTEKSLPAAQYCGRLKDQFERTIGTLGTPAWAQLHKESANKRASEDSDESSSGEEAREAEAALTRATGAYTGAPTRLPKRLLNCRKLKDVSFGHRVPDKPITSVQFHPNARILMTAGHHDRMSLYEIGEKENRELHSVKLKRFGLESARFSPDGNRVFMGSRQHAFFYYYDLIRGDVNKVHKPRGLELTNMKNFAVSADGRFLVAVGHSGQIHVLSATSFEWISTLKANDEVAEVCFSAVRPSQLFSHGDDGCVRVWDVKQRSCVHSFTDEGCIKGTSVTLSDDGRLLATGSNTGVVNVYQTDSILKTNTPKPLKALMNLTTSIGALAFNSTSEILASASAELENSLRFMHAGSRTVFSNFPTRMNLGHVTSMNFSPNSGYFAVGNADGRAKLFRLFHYHDF